MVLEKETAAAGGFAERTVGGDGSGLGLAGSALSHNTFVPGWLAFASSTFVWPLTEFLFRGFFKTSLQELFLLQSPDSAVGPSNGGPPKRLEGVPGLPFFFSFSEKE